MMDVYIILAVNRRELQEHLKKHRKIENYTRLQVIKYNCKTLPVYAVTTLSEASADCRHWNRQGFSSVHYWEKVSLY